MKSKAHKRELIEHALLFERAAAQMLQEFVAARKFDKEREGMCEPGVIEEAANARKHDAGCLFSMTKAWDAALERWRLLKGVPGPGSRRPTDPPPKVAKPRNKPPDTLGDGTVKPTE